MNFKIPLFKTYSDESDVKAVEAVIKRGTFWAVGPEIEQFEKKTAEYVGRKHAVSFNSGTSALHSLFLAYGLTEGEVIVPSFTFISSANSVLLAGATPVFAEVESETLGLDPSDVESRITDKTKAIMPTHYGGLSCKIRELKKIAEDRDLLLIEDAAQSFGSNIDGKMVGSFGDSAMFSFCQNKLISTGEGGVIITDSEDVYEKLKLIRSHGRVEAQGEDYFSSTGDMDYIQLGYNFRMPTMIAALGLSQLNKISTLIAKRRENAHYLNEKLSQVDGLKLPAEPEGYFHVYQMYTVQLEDPSVREALQNHLKEAGVMTKVYFNPIHLKTLYTKKYGYKDGDLPRTEELSRKVLTLPMSAVFTKDDFDLVAGGISSFFKR